VWLAIGALAGLTLAATGLLEPRGDPAIPEDAVARVGEALILRENYTRVLAGIERDTRSPVDDATRERVLERMIDEELLVQRATELGLARYDRRVRSNLVSALIASIVADAEDTDPSREVLHEFFAAEAEWFAKPGRLRVRQVFFRIPNPGDEEATRERALAARRQLLDGVPFPEVKATAGDPEVFSIPDSLLPSAKVVEYLGPSALRAARDLKPGEVSEPIRSPSGFHLIWLVDREASLLPAFESIEPQVRAEWVRRAGDRALRTYLEDLRERAEISLTETLP
jgi:peptidylprolyl isomerase